MAEPAELKCVICQDSEEYNDFNSSANCRHRYHRECGDSWIASEMAAHRIPLCPLCKKNLLPRSESNSRPDSPSRSLESAFNSALHIESGSDEEEERGESEEEHVDIDNSDEDMDLLLDSLFPSPPQNNQEPPPRVQAPTEEVLRSASTSRSHSRRDSIASSASSIQDLFVGYDPEFDYIKETESGKPRCMAINSRHMQCRLAVRAPSRYLCARHLKLQATEESRKKAQELFEKKYVLQEIGQAKKAAEMRILKEAEGIAIMQQKIKELESRILLSRSAVIASTSSADDYINQYDIKPKSRNSSRSSSRASSSAPSRQ